MPIRIMQRTQRTAQAAAADPPLNSDSGPANSPSEPAPDALINTTDGLKYWESIDADVNGMLGGFQSISRIDLQGSRNFLAKYFGIGTKSDQRTVKRALEGGAGIGRITEGLLLSLAEEVDVVEPVKKFTDELKKKCPGVREVFNVGLQDWAPQSTSGTDFEGDGEDERYYDLVWTQWCVGHLTDDQLVRYLERCKTVLKPGVGVIVVKENLSTSGKDIFDETDSSVTRQDEKFQQIFKQAGLRIVKMEVQRGFPKGLYPVKTYALQPEEAETV